MATPVVGTVIYLPEAFGESFKPYLDSIRGWNSFGAASLPGRSYGNAQYVGAFQRYPRAFALPRGPR